jgi:acetate---CoA ligase (ADP-forming)
MTESAVRRPESLTPAGPRQPADRSALQAMLEARSVALVGASPRPGSFGRRLLEEAAKSTSRPRLYPVNPRYAELDGLPCFPTLADLPEPAELALLAVPDAALEGQLALAARCGVRSAVIFGSAYEARERLASLATDAGMALCGAGCMGFINVSGGLRAIGYTEAEAVPDGPVALVTHSGSVFSALLRARRRIGFTLAVSSGQELVTAAPAYIDYALGLPGTRVLALVLEAIRDGAALRAALVRAGDQDVPVVMLTTGHSAAGKAMVAAHSGALAAADGGWEALARAHGVHRVADLAELADTVELFAAGRRAPRAAAQPDRRPGIATVHDSGLERTHVVDLAGELAVPFADIGTGTMTRLAGLLAPGLAPDNPLDVWGTGAGTRELFAASLTALADDPAVQAVALAIDLVPELDGDPSYPQAMLDLARHTTKPVAVLTNLSSAIDLAAAAELRAAGVPVLEGTRSGLLALRHLIEHGSHEHGRSRSAAARQQGPATTREVARQRRGLALLTAGPAGGPALLGLLADYGIGVPAVVPVESAAAAQAAAAQIGYPVVLKTDEPAIQHKSDVGGVVLGITGPEQLAACYAEMTRRLGPRTAICQMAPPGVELTLGIARDPELGPLLVIGAGGVLVELLADRVVALPPVSDAEAHELVAGLRAARLLAGIRGAAPASMDAVAAAITGLSQLAIELGDELDALDVNPLICGPDGAVAVDALAIPRPGRG